MAVCLVSVSMAAGCAQGHRIAGGDAKIAEAEDSAAFLDRVSSQTKVTENDALRGILLLVDGKDTEATFDLRIKALTSRKIADPSWEYAANKPVSRGKMAYMIYQACKMQGGVTLMLTGPTQRYCLREMQFIKMFGAGAVYGDVSGMEFVSILNRADDYIHKPGNKFSEAANAAESY